MIPRFSFRTACRNRALAFALGGLGFALALPSCAGFSAQAGEPDRIVVLGGAITEILYDLGASDRIAAVDTTSLYPPAALKEKPNVGYFRAVSAEGVLATKPSQVLAIDGAGPKAALDAIAGAGIKVVSISDQPTPDGVAAKIATVGTAIGAEAAASRLADDVAHRFAEVARARSALTTSKRVLFVMTVQNGRLLAAGRSTAADAMIGLAGATNVATFDGYKPIGDEALVEAAPEAILVMTRNGSDPTADILAVPAVAATPAGKSHTVIAMDGLYLLGFGPRTPDAVRDLMAALAKPAAVQTDVAR